MTWQQRRDKLAEQWSAKKYPLYDIDLRLLAFIDYQEIYTAGRKDEDVLMLIKIVEQFIDDPDYGIHTLEKAIHKFKGD